MTAATMDELKVGSAIRVIAGFARVHDMPFDAVMAFREDYLELSMVFRRSEEPESYDSTSRVYVQAPRADEDEDETFLLDWAAMALRHGLERHRMELRHWLGRVTSGAADTKRRPQVVERLRRAENYLAAMKLIEAQSASSAADTPG
jgi:hypothetical protein